jgi:hypothetical protein
MPDDRNDEPFTDEELGFAGLVPAEPPQKPPKAPKWSRKPVPKGLGIEIVGLWKLSEVEGDTHLAIAHKVPDGNWYDDLGRLVADEPPFKWAPCPDRYK